ncbi:MAG TPA: carboxypeptidase regulatory-like domain-containing protein, partial [Thermoanaerobaculia bacterium]
MVVEVRSGERAEKTIGGQRLARISGTVVDEERRPIGAAAVGVAEDSRRQMAAYGTVMSFAMPSSVAIARPFWSSSDGEWVVREAPVDRETVVEAVRTGLPHGKTDAMKLGPGEKKEKVVIVIPRGITVDGRVRARGGEPIANATVGAELRDPGAPAGVRPPRYGSPSVIETVTTAADGAFSIQLARGTYDITADADGYAMKTARGVEVQGEVEPVALELEEGVSVTGRLVRADGSGVPDAFVSASGAKQSAVTGSDGGFAIADLPRGPVQLSAYKPLEYVRESLMIDAPASNVEIRLPAAGTIRGRVLEKGSKTPVTDFRAGPAAERRGTTQRMMMPSILQSFRSDDGSFELPNVPAGPIEVVAEATGFVSGAASVTVEGGKTTDEITILLEPGTRVVGRVTAPDGTPLGGASVSVAASETNPLPGTFTRSGQATSDANGEYAISAVAPGERSFRASHRSYPPLVREANVSGREARLDLQFERGIELAGLVVREGGVPI